VWQVLWKKPIGASEDELALNVRSRSAKLRAARRRAEDVDEQGHDEETGR
jgi:16S rRNA C1402 N4-methylase RsmH